MMTDMNTKELESALQWRGDDLQVSVCALWPSSTTHAAAETALTTAVGDSFPAGFTVRVEQTTPQHPWFCSVDAQVKDVPALARVLPGLLARLTAQGAAAAWAGFEGAVATESDVFSSELGAHHYGVACGPTVGIALDDSEREGARWKSTVAECRLRLARLLPSLVTPT